MTIGGSEKLQNIPGDLEDRVYTQDCAHSQGCGTARQDQKKPSSLTFSYPKALHDQKDEG